MSEKKSPKPASFDERAPYEVIPSSKDGEQGFASRRAQLADLNAKSFTESTRTGDGSPEVNTREVAPSIGGGKGGTTRGGIGDKVAPTIASR